MNISNSSITMWLLTLLSMTILLLLSCSSTTIFTNAQLVVNYRYTIGHTQSNFRQMKYWKDTTNNKDYMLVAYIGSGTGGLARYLYDTALGQWKDDGYLDLGLGCPNPSSLAVVGNKAFVGCDDSPSAKIQAVNLLPFGNNGVQTITSKTQPLWATESPGSPSRAIFVCANGGSAGTLIFMVAATHAYSQPTLTYSNPRGVIVDDGDAHVFVTFREVPPKICRYRLSDEGEDACAPLDATDGFVEGEMAIEGGNLYLTSQNTPTRIIKITQTTLARAAFLDLNTGEDKAYAIAIDTATKTLFAFTNTNPAKIVRVNCADLSRIDAIDAPGDGKNSYAMSSVMYGSDTVLFVTATYPGHLVEFGPATTAAPTPVPASTNNDGSGSGSGSGVDYNYLGNILRVGVMNGQQTSNPITRQACHVYGNEYFHAISFSPYGQTTVEIVDSKVYTVNATETVGNNVGFVRTCLLDESRKDILFVGSNSAGDIVVVRRSHDNNAFQYLNIFAYALPSDQVFWIDATNDYLFALVRGDTYSSIVRVDLTSTTVLSESLIHQLPNTFSAEARTIAVGKSDTKLYVASSSGSPANLIEVKDINDPSMTTGRQLDIAGTLGYTNVQMDLRMSTQDISGYLFVIAQRGASEPPVAIKVDVTSFTVVAHGVIGASEGLVSLGGFIPDSHNMIAYLIGNRGSSSLPSMYIRLNLTTMTDYIVEYTFEDNGKEYNGTDCVGVRDLTLACVFPNEKPAHVVLVRRSTDPRVDTSTQEGDIEPVITRKAPTKQTDVSSPPPFSIESVEGNIFMPTGYDANSCNNTQVKSVVQKCIDDFHVCYGNKRFDLNQAICPLTLSGCIVSYSKCLLNEGKTLLASGTTTTTTSCPWAPAFFSAGMSAAASGSQNDLYDCAVFVKTFATRYFNCFPMIPEICGDVVNVFAADAKANSPQAIKDADLTQTKKTKFPRGMLPIVVSKNETAKECTRPYFDSSCKCPLGFKRMRLYEPSYLFAGPNEPEKKQASNYDICYDRSVPILENVTFEVALVARPNAQISEADEQETKNRRADPSSSSYKSDAQCTGPGQTLRELKVLAENSAGLAKGRILAICAPPDTNVFIINSINSGCYSPRANVSCSCGSSATSIGVPITYLNETTNVADSGMLIICNFPLPQQITTQQAVTVGITGISSLSSGPQAQGLQAAAVVSLLDCQSEDSEAQQQGGRFALVPGQVGDSEAAGMIFILVIIFGTLFVYLLVCLIIAIFRYNSCCCDFCSGHDKADPALTENPERAAYKSLLKAHREKKRAKAIEVASGVFEKQESLTKQATSTGEFEKNESTTTTKHQEQPEGEEAGMFRQETSMTTRDAELAGFQNEAYDQQGNALTRKSVEKTVDEKLIITYVNEATGDEKKKVLRAKFKYAHLDNKKLGFSYHFFTACCTMRFPGLFTFTILKFFFQGLAYESIYLTTREEPGNFTHSLGVVGCVLTGIIVLAFIILGRALEHHNYCEYAQYKKLYKNWPEWMQSLIAPDGNWPDNDRSWRNGLAWDDYSGNCRFLSVAVPLSYIKGLLLAGLTAPPWSFETCQYIYWVLIAVFIVFGLLLLALRPVYRFPLATFSDAIIGTLTGIGLLLYIQEWPGQADVYTAIVYLGLVLAILMQVLGFHEFFVGFCVEVDEDEDDNAEDWETDVEEDEGTVRREQPKMKELVDEFKDDQEMQRVISSNSDGNNNNTNTTSQEMSPSSNANEEKYHYTTQVARVINVESPSHHEEASNTNSSKEEQQQQQQQQTKSSSTYVNVS